MIQSLEDLAALRQRINAGETVSDESLAEAVAFARTSRLAISGRAIGGSKKAKSVPVDLASLFTGMGGTEKA